MNDVVGYKLYVLKEVVVVQEGALCNLPEVMVEFTAYKVSGAQVVLFNKQLAKGADQNKILHDYSYVIDLAASTKKSDVSKKTFCAERYGGGSISRNGGGGRCGYDGLFQLKGIGKTPLVGAHKLCLKR